MPSNYSQAGKRSGRYKPTPDLTPIYGVRLFGTESAYLMSFLAMALYAAARIYMSTIEQRHSGTFDIFAILGIAASAMLLGGGLLVLLGTHIKSLPGIFLFSGIALLMLSDGIFCFTVSFETLSESDILGVIQCVFEVLFLLSLFILLTSLLISCLNRRTASSVGHLPTVTSIFAVVLLLFRTLTTFASLASALGSSFSWDQTGDLAAEVNWVLRSVSPDSDYAADMYFARLFERITLVLMYAAFMPPIFKFASFFRQYNTQMQIAAQMPGGQRTVREQRGNSYASGRFDLMSSLHDLRESEITEAPDTAATEDDAAETLESEELGYCTPDYISGFDEPEELFFEEPQTIPAEENIPEPEAPPVVYNTDPLSPDYGKPVEVAEAPAAVSAEPPEKSGITQRVKIKPKSTIPSPDDEGFWDQYADDQ